MRKSLGPLFLGAACVASTAAAQSAAPGSSQSIDDVRKDYRIHAGALYVNPSIQLKELGVDTNVFNEPTAERKSDFTFTFTPGAQLAVPIARRALLKVAPAADVVYYARYDSERSLDPQVSARAELYVTRLTLFAEDAYIDTRQRPNFEIDVRSRHRQNDATAGLALRLTGKFSVETALTRGETRFAGDAYFLGQRLQETLDRRSDAVTVAARHRLSPLTTLSVTYVRERDRFPYAPVRNTDSFRVMPGVEFKPKALISGTAFVGYRRFSPISPAVPQFSGLVSQLALAYTLLGSTAFGVTYDRDVNYSFEAVTPYYVDNSPGLFVKHAIGGRFDVMASVARHRYEYQTVATPGPAADRIDTTDMYGASIGYRVKRQARVGIGAWYYTRASNTAFRQYDGLRVGTTVNYGF